MHQASPLASQSRFLLRLAARGALVALVALAAVAPAPAVPARAAAATPAGAAGGFLSPAAAGDPLDIAMAYLKAHTGDLGLDAADLNDLVVADRYVSQHNGVTHLYLRQRYAGIEVYNGDINVNVMPDGRILNLGNRFVPGLQGRVNARAPRVEPAAAVRSSAAALGLPTPAKLNQAAGAAPGSYVISGAPAVQGDIPAHLIYLPLDDGQVRLAWDVQIQPEGRADYWSMRADALTGQVLSQVNWTVDERFGPEYLSDAAASPAAGSLPAAHAGPAAIATPDTYEVYATPLRSPLGGNRTQVSAPANPQASPLGWHDTDGAAGAEYSTTRGNNAHAYADIDGADGFSAGDAEADGGPNRVFSSPLDLSQQPNAYRPASITNLFYWTNVIHDITYQYGFDEAAGNFQHNTYGRGGAGNDSVKAEAQDSAGRNNANFFTPPDGSQPRMQMYLWNGPISSLLRVLTPASADYAHGRASFGPTTFAITGTLALVNDGVDPTSDGCQTPFTNAAALAGKIAVIDRGNCEFSLKVLNAQNAGAIGVIIVNNAAGNAPGMGAGSANPTIPALSLSQTDGAALKAQMAQGPVTATLQRSTLADIDGSFDSEIIIHEYGHGISNRLTGGPQNSSCVFQEETGSEGWSDFLALALTPNPADTRDTARAMSTFATATSADSAGIRRYPYSTNLAVNPLTYDSLKLPGSGGRIAEVHDVGEVWAAMLWEVYWNMVDDHGFSADLYNGTAGNNRAIQLALDGMKLQPCQPSFAESRDAILAADRADYNGADECRIWEAFAKRGLGYSAVAGSSADATDGQEAFDVPPTCGVKVDPPRAEVCAPTSARFNVGLGPLFSGPVTLSASGLPAGASATFGASTISRPGTTSLAIGNIAGVPPGRYSITVQGAGSAATYATGVELGVSNTKPAAATLNSPANGATGQSLRPAFSWNASANALGYRFELAADPKFSTVIYTSAVDGTSLDLPRGLTAGTTYYWRVRPLNGCGAGTPAAASFSVRTASRTLLVDDDEDAPDVRARFTQALDGLSVSYDVWDAASLGEPDAAVLANYATVLWAGGHYGSPADDTENELAGYLNGGGCLFISSQEYFYNAGLTPFMQQYLGVASATGDVGHSQATGAGALFGGLGPFTLDPTGIDSQYMATDSDIITPALAAELAFTGSKGNAGVFHDGGRYRSVYLGFALEAITSASGRQSVLQRSLSWCNALPLAITSGAPAAGRVGHAYSHRFSATGVPAPSFSISAGALPPGLTLSAGGLLSGVPTQAGTFSGLVVAASNGQNPGATQSFTIVVASGGRVFLPVARR